MANLSKETRETMRRWHLRMALKDSRNLQQDIEMLILQTPTGIERDELSVMNIHMLAQVAKLEAMVK